MARLAGNQIWITKFAEISPISYVPIEDHASDPHIFSCFLSLQLHHSMSSYHLEHFFNLKSLQDWEGEESQ